MSAGRGAVGGRGCAISVFQRWFRSVLQGVVRDEAFQRADLDRIAPLAHDAEPFTLGFPGTHPARARRKGVAAPVELGRTDDVAFRQQGDEVPDRVTVRAPFLASRRM